MAECLCAAATPSPSSVHFGSREQVRSEGKRTSGLIRDLPRPPIGWYPRILLTLLKFYFSLEWKHYSILEV